MRYLTVALYNTSEFFNKLEMILRSLIFKNFDFAFKRVTSSNVGKTGIFGYSKITLKIQYDFLKIQSSRVPCK